MKRIISIAVILVTVLALMVPVLASAEDGKDMWVNCSNGKSLNVRTEPSTKG